MTGPSPAAAPDDALLAEALHAEQVRQVYRQAARNQVFSPVVAALMSVGLWAHVDHRLLAGWVLAMALASAARQALARTYLRRAPAPADAPRWGRRFLLSTTAVGMLWGVGGWLFMRGNAPRVDLYTYAFLIGMAGGTSAIYAAHARTVMVAVTAILLPPTAQLVAQGHLLSLTMALGGVLFVLAIGSSVRLLNDAIRRSVTLALQLERQARIDALSGLANRRALMESGQALLAHAARTGRACAALMVDVDHFKRVNDTRGHAAGDAVIAATGALLAQSVRAGELVGRIGGEEFVVLLPDGDAAQASALAARILQRMRAMTVPHADGPVAVTASIGVAMAHGGSLQALLERADRALYRAKAAGRDRVEVDADGIGDRDGSSTQG